MLSSYVRSIHQIPSPFLLISPSYIQQQIERLQMVSKSFSSAPPSSVLPPDPGPFLQKINDYIESVTNNNNNNDSNINNNPNPNPNTYSNTKMFEILMELDPLEIARQLTLLEWDLAYRIRVMLMFSFSF